MQKIHNVQNMLNMLNVQQKMQRMQKLLKSKKCTTDAKLPYLYSKKYAGAAHCN